MELWTVVCDTPNGFGDLALTARVLNCLPLGIKANVIILLGDQDGEQVKRFVELTYPASIRVHAMSLSRPDISILKTSVQRKVLFVPQSNLTLANFQRLRQQARLTTEIDPYGITEYDVDPINIAEVSNPIIQLGFGQQGVFLNPNRLTSNMQQLREKWLIKYRSDTGRPTLQRIILAYVMAEHVPRFITLMSYLYRDGVPTVVVAPRLKAPLGRLPPQWVIVNDRYSPLEFLELVQVADEPIGVTGDQSLLDCLSAGRVPYYDMPAWKESLWEAFIQYVDNLGLGALSSWMTEQGDEEFAAVQESTDAIDLAAFLKTDFSQVENKLRLLMVRWMDTAK